jgi:hypothetical protein
VSTEKSTTIKANGYEYHIKETTLSYGDRIISHTFTMGGDYPNCLTVSLFYDYGQETPRYAKIPYIEYDPGCSIGSTLPKGTGTIHMLTTCIRYIHEKYPSVTRFKFDDMSHIDCSEQQDEKDEKDQKDEKKMPLNHAYFSIAYHGGTWYEKNFHAEQENPEQHKAYRARLLFLESEKPDFITFLQLAQPPADQFAYLEEKYGKTSTYHTFFQSIPKEDRCRILRPWLDTFMRHYLGDVFHNTGWVIDVQKLPSVQRGGNRGNKNKNRNRNRKTFKKKEKNGMKLISYEPRHFLGIRIEDD